MAIKLVTLLCLLKLVSGLTDSDKWCIEDNPGTLDNNFLLGTWYEVYKFAPNLNLLSSSWCAAINITASTAEDVARYSTVHSGTEVLKIDSTAVLFDRYLEGQKGMLTGGDEVKFFAWDPESVFMGTRDYISHAFRKINDDYLLYNSCTLSSIKFLWSRRRDQTAAELLELISTISEVQRLETQRLCA